MKRTVFYARVSTDSHVQLHSLSQQRDFFMNYIQKNPNYIYYGEYVDEGITGTSMKKRTAFNRMINDALQHKFDLILVKDISRFSRNTLDSIEQTRRLKREGIDVIFINDHIDTSQADSEINLTLMATMAQEESRKISNRVNWGMRNEMKNGVMFIESIYGYDVVDRKLVVNESQAEVVRMIYQLYLDGYGYYRIVMKLKELGIKSPKGKEKWNYDTIRKILSNEKYKGTLVSGKTHVQDFISKKQVYTDENTRLIFENHHEPIIDKEVFEQVQSLMAKKRQQHTHSHKKIDYLLSRKVICDECQGSYMYDSSQQRLYCSNVKYHTCSNNHSILENEMKEMLRTVFQELFIDEDKIQEKVINVIKSSLSYQNAHQQQTQNEKKLHRLQKYQDEFLNRLLTGEISSEEYKQLESVNMKEIKRLEDEINRLKENNKLDKYNTSLTYIKKELSHMFKNSDELLKKMIQQFIVKIVIRNRNDFDIYFNLSSNFVKEFHKSDYTLFLELNYDFSELELKYTQKKYKNLKNTTIRIYH